jgi:hypothetical protein
MARGFAFSPWTLKIPFLAALTLAASFERPVRADSPKEIVLDQSAAARPLDATEQNARDSALMAGATEVEEPYRILTTKGGFSREIGVQRDRCYYVSVAYLAGFRMNITWTFGSSAEGGAVSDAVRGGHAVTGSNGGVGRFCVDHTGTVQLGLGLETSSQDMHDQVEYALVVGWRQQTPAQIEARHRCVASSRREYGACDP